MAEASVKGCCPTCGSPSGSAEATRRCTSCSRLNPIQFNYCGFCATPLENTNLRAEIAKVAAPPGGWPNIAAELVELKFFLRRGQVEDAYELLAILNKRHPGHPVLGEFSRVPTSTSEEEIGAAVERAFADSSQVSSRNVRRAAPPWDAPQARAAAVKTTAHEALSLATPELSSHLSAGLGDDSPPPAAASPAVHLATRTYRAVDPATVHSQTGLTVAVKTLQPAKPWTSETGASVQVRSRTPAEERPVSRRAVVASAVSAEAAPTRAGVSPARSPARPPKTRSSHPPPVPTAFSAPVAPPMAARAGDRQTPPPLPETKPTAPQAAAQASRLSRRTPPPVAKPTGAPVAPQAARTSRRTPPPLTRPAASPPVSGQFGGEPGVPTHIEPTATHVPIGDGPSFADSPAPKIVRQPSIVVTGPAPELQRPVTARRTAVGHRRGKKGKKAVPAKRRRREGSGPNPKGQSFGKNVLLRFGVSST